MDKLEPILKQKFWIILGIGVIMTFTGWWMATGSLAATIQQRKDAISQAEQGIPTGEVPNDDWSSKLAKINDLQETMVTGVRRQMWEQQKEVMIWPETLQEFVDEVGYQGEFGLVARDLYRSAYTFAVEDVWKEVNPIDLDGTGVVWFPRQSMPIKKDLSVASLAPTSEDIWAAQEDLWLLSGLLKSIREVNGGENGTRLDASIHVIEKLELMGGERTTGESSTSSGDPGSGGMEGGGMGMSGGMAGLSRDNAGKVASADFNPEEEFGTTGREKSSGSGGSFAMSMTAEGSADGGGGTDGPVKTRRYVDDDESAPFKTRAFYLLVIMDHRQVPNLLAALSASGDSPWPVEIVRMQMSRINPDDVEGRSVNPSMPMGFGPGGGMASSGTMEEGYADSTSGSGFSSSAFGEPGMTGGIPGGGQVPQVSLDVSLQDPYMARVAIAGLIYLYRPVDAPPASEPGSETPTDAVTETGDETAMPADSAATEPATGDPAAPVDPAADPAEPGTNPQAPASANPSETPASVPDAASPAPAAPAEAPAPEAPAAQPE